MSLRNEQKIVLIIVLGFFGILIIFALFVRCNRKVDDLDVPGSSVNSQDLQNKIDIYYEENKDDVEAVKSSTSGGVYTALVVTNKKSTKGDYNIPIYKAYYYSTKNDREINRDEALQILGYTDEYIKTKILDHFRKLYNQEIEEGYVDKNECDLEECYLSFYRDINDINSYVLNVENGNLNVYISFDIDSLVDDKEFFDKLDYDYYKIEIK